MSGHKALESGGVDIGEQWWFRTLVAVLWLLVGALAAIGVYSVAPGIFADVPTLLVGSLVSLFLLVVVTIYIGRALATNYQPQRRF
ncbi:hypothetical protein [Natranaeroarchaeum aerophilus]|uniref:Uncharacterized protein n=1 Tax=Natranaeroarchaeum aerophilus TaxID=2917711 RepID=A0AAE3FQL9_9EURY|nr:hypothetical protein [Natranaeroarchaeum aerophilus]MCL9813078.1 hypothetical protein [Natranaeroarchaeum aerophilus]